MNKHVWIAIGGLSLWILETSFFGFNTTAQSGAEVILDGLALYLMWGILGDILTGVQFSKITNIYTYKDPQ